MFSVISTGMWLRPLCTAIARPTISGRIIERRDQVLIGRRSFLAAATCVFLASDRSTNGPFLSERGTMPPYLRRVTMKEFVRLLWRVFLPLVCQPHGETGCGLPCPDLPSP